MDTVQILDFLEGWFVKDGTKYLTHQALTCTQNDKGVRYELQRCTTQVYKAYCNYTFPLDCAVYYDRFGRISRLDCT